MDSHDCTIKVLFNELYIFEVPNYQRNFVWEKDEIKEYLKDIIYCYEANNDRLKYEHFFGQMVLRLKNEDRAMRQHYEIVDGQQRLTTFTLTVIAACSLIRHRFPTITESLKSDAEKVIDKLKKEYIISEPSEGRVCRKLTLSSKDNPTLMSITKMTDVIDVVIDEIKYESQQRILDAYEEIYEYITKYFEKIDSDSIYETLYEFIDGFSKQLSLVLIKSTTEGYSYALYQIVNDRGVLLTPAELLKARTMELLSDSKYFLNCEKIWNDILNDSGKFTTKCLSWHYTSKVFKNPKPKKLHEQYERDLFNCYGKHRLLENEKSELAREIQDLYDSVLLCRNLSSGVIPINKLNCQMNDLYNTLICALKNETAIPLFINILRIDNDNKKIDICNKMILLLVKFFFVARTIASMHPTSISNLYNSISKKIYEDKFSLKEIQDMCQEKIKVKKCMDTFNTKISQSIYTAHSTTICKFLLYMLELFYGSNTYDVSFILNRDTSVKINFSEITTEHIACRNESENDDSGLTMEQKNSLGNLTIIGANINNSMNDKNYQQKKNIYANSPYAITREVSHNTNWDYNAYAIRHNQVINDIISIFKI